MPRSWFSDPEQARLLDSPDWPACERLIKAFEDAWRRGDAPAIRDHLAAEGPARRALLVELAHIDLEFRWKAGRAAGADDYLAAYPELAADPGAAAELRAAEAEFRRLRPPAPPPQHPTQAGGDTPDPAGKAPAAPAGLPDVPGYEVLGELGRGGMGVVYKARDPSLGRLVALKFLPDEYAGDPHRLDRFRREARTTSALNHPHICTVHALGEYRGRPFLVMELVEGVTLQALLPRRPAPAEAARLVAQAARALAAAHAAGVVHRDVKPENVMVRADGYVKVLDFGLARRLPTLARADPAGGRATDLGAVLGTVPYMSPEQARGEPVGGASDVFSLGIVLHELATGRHPFGGDSPLDTLFAICERDPVPASRHNPEVPAPLDGLIGAMLHKDARLRPTAGEVVAALEAVGGGAARGPAPRPVVRREPELAALRDALAEADAGRGSLVCVAGEPGIGKTTLVEGFLDELADGGGRLVARGHCSERLADTEAYLPVLDALGDLLRGPAGAAASRLMQVVAPTWYARAAPAARGPAALAEGARASSQPAMLREFGGLVEEAARLGTVVLFFDDVHWADVSTVDLLAHLGRRAPALRLLAVVTYRPTELLLGPHPFHPVKLDLQARGACAELALGFLSRDDVGLYLALAFPGHAFPADFADLVHARTEGSPLFMADLLRYLRERGVVAESAGRWELAREVPDLRRELPGSVRGMIQRKLDRLSESDRRLLAAAAVQGPEFDAAVVAGALAWEPAEVEERLQRLDRVHGLVRLDREQEFPDGILTSRYAFVHVLYQQALEAELAPARRAALAAALARALERHHGEEGPAAAAELACLYEAGRDFARAAHHSRSAAENAARVFAHREAVALARRGLRLLEKLPDSPGRAALELPLQQTLGLQLQLIEGYAAPAAERAYTRARELSQRAPGDPPLFPVLWGLWLFSKVRSELDRARVLADELRALAERLGDPAALLQTGQALTVTALCRGEPAAAVAHMERVAALYDPERHGGLSFSFGQDPGVASRAFGAVALWLLGRPDEAVRQGREAARRSHELSNPNSQALALHFAAMVHQLRRDAGRARVCAETAGAIAAEHGFSFWQAGAAVLSGWAVAAGGAADEGADRLRRGLDDWAATGSVTYRTYYLGLLAEVRARQGKAEEAGCLLDEALALARQTREGLYEAELYRLRGEARLSLGDDPARAEEDFRAALEVARRQQARSLGLRAATSLAGLAVRRGDRAGARALLGEALAGFTEGAETADLREARGLHDALG
jgi:predicted ATPase